MSQITLPTIYTEEMWARSKDKFNKKFIGKPYLSWSQIETFLGKTGFNTGLIGKYEYMRKYFSKEKYPDMGWAQFGSEAEAYITLRDSDISKLDQFDADCLKGAIENFSDKEKEILSSIKPLGVFQEEICYYIKELDIIVLGFLDDRSKSYKKVVKMLRDYKTKSKSSKKDLHKPEKRQIEIYTMGLRQKDIEVKEAEYCIIERLGGKECMNGGGRASLYVGDNVWYEPYELSEERFEETHQILIDAALEISSLYSTYIKLFG